MGVSVIVPTYNEKDNVLPLVQRIHKALKGLDYEIIFVDDGSPDGTANMVRRLAVTDRRLKLISRPRKMGLGSAVLTGVGVSSYDRIVVMDADLQHPPEVIPLMVRELENKDLVVATRQRISGWEGYRLAVSKLARALSYTFVPRARGITDPLSGFFGARKQVVDKVISTSGYKILLEVIARGKWKSLGEVPYVFAGRKSGKSKLNSKEYVNYIRLLFGLAFCGSKEPSPGLADGKL